MRFGQDVRLFESSFSIPPFYRAPFARCPAYAHLGPHWLSSPLGQRYVVELIRGGLPSSLWPARVRESVIDAVADVLLAAVSAWRSNGGGS